MTMLALQCPQCGAPLPRQALWRHVVCGHCGSTVTRSAESVRRAGFREALQRARSDAAAHGNTLTIAGARYRLLCVLGRARAGEVWAAERAEAPARLVVKLAEGDGAPRLAREASNLRQLHALDAPGAAAFADRLPRLVHHGKALDAAGRARDALVLRHAEGSWGTLAGLVAARGRGIDPRHAVWIWRRGLEVLGWVHRNGWTHGDLGPSHLLVHPRDHGLTPIGWSDAVAGTGRAHDAAAGRDLQQLAWSVRSVLAGPTAGPPPIPASTPAPLAQLLRRASEDRDGLAAAGAAALEAELSAAASQSFGPPRFVPFDPLGD